MGLMMRIGERSIPPEECPDIITWGSQAIGVVDAFLFGPSPSVQPIPFRLISSSGISEMENEPMPPVEGIGNIAAGEAGIAIVYSGEVSGSTVDVIEYSESGRLWSRLTLPDFRGRQVVVGSEEVVVYGPFGLDGLLVGNHEPQGVTPSVGTIHSTPRCRYRAGLGSLTQYLLWNFSGFRNSKPC